MAYRDVDAAIDGTLMQEDAVKDASLVFDKDFSYLRDTFNLPVDDTTRWPSIFATRLERQNKVYNRRIKEEIRLYSHNLRMFHARRLPSLSSSGDSSQLRPQSSNQNAMSILVSLVVQAIRGSNTMAALFLKFGELHRAIGASQALSFPDKVFIRNSLPNLELCVNRLNTDTLQLKEMFNTHKPSLYILAYEDELAKCLHVMRGRKLLAHRLEHHAKGPLDTLSRMSKRREEIVEISTRIGMERVMGWFSLPGGRVSEESYEAALNEHKSLIAEIDAQKPEHDEAAHFLLNLHELANSTPNTIPGPDNKEIPIAGVREAFQGYELMIETCREMIETSEPIIGTLKEYIQFLDQLVSY